MLLLLWLGMVQWRVLRILWIIAWILALVFRERVRDYWIWQLESSSGWLDDSSILPFLVFFHSKSQEYQVNQRMFGSNIVRFIRSIHLIAVMMPPIAMQIHRLIQKTTSPPLKTPPAHPSMPNSCAEKNRKKFGTDLSKEGLAAAGRMNNPLAAWKCGQKWKQKGNPIPFRVADENQPILEIT